VQATLLLHIMGWGYDTTYPRKHKPTRRPVPGDALARRRAAGRVDEDLERRKEERRGPLRNSPRDRATTYGQSITPRCGRGTWCHHVRHLRSEGPPKVRREGDLCGGCQEHHAGGYGRSRSDRWMDEITEAVETVTSAPKGSVGSVRAGAARERRTGCTLRPRERSPALERRGFVAASGLAGGA
jgi:hypothetical protein